MLKGLFGKKTVVQSAPQEEKQSGFCNEPEKILQEIRSLQNAVNELMKPTDNAVAIITDMDKSFLSYISKAINHVISVSDILKQSKQINLNIDTLDSWIEKQAESINQTSSAVEQMSANISSVSNILNENNRVMESLLAASGEGTSGIQRVMEIMKDLVTNSEVLQDASKMILTIASQTNLLAMNASIEAAHAGRSGQGFAVVADEIRKLAENCSTQGKSISKVLKELQQEINNATALTGQSQTKFENIAALVDQARQQGQTIGHAMNEQKTGSTQILEATHQIQEATRNVKDWAKIITESSLQIPVAVGELESETAIMSKAINDLMGSIEDMEAATHDFSSGVCAIRENINQIHETIRRNGNAV